MLFLFCCLCYILSLLFCVCLFFFFKQKTAYEMRISDWSSDVCSSDLDITRSVLTQIIFEEESKGQNLMPIGFLRRLITFYGDSLQTLVPSYLEVSMASFPRNQEQMRPYMFTSFVALLPFRNILDMCQIY